MELSYNPDIRGEIRDELLDARRDFLHARDWRNWFKAGQALRPWNFNRIMKQVAAQFRDDVDADKIETAIGDGSLLQLFLEWLMSGGLEWLLNLIFGFFSEDE